jgi:hypothetical protein
LWIRCHNISFSCRTTTRNCLEDIVLSAAAAAALKVLVSSPVKRDPGRDNLSF